MVNLGVYLVTDGNLFLPLFIPPTLLFSLVLPVLHIFGYRHSFEKVNGRGMLVRTLSLKKNNFHLLEELCHNCSPSQIHIALSSGCHLQGAHLITGMKATFLHFLK